MADDFTAFLERAVEDALRSERRRRGLLTPDDIAHDICRDHPDCTEDTTDLEADVATAIRAEREACAHIAEGFTCTCGLYGGKVGGRHRAWCPQGIAEAIRDRPGGEE